MIAYIFLLFFVIFWVGIFYKFSRYKEIIVPFIFLVLFATIRNIEVGTDTAMYSRVFLDNIALDNFYFDPRLEYGYQYLVYLIMHIDKEYYLLFLFTSIIIVFNNLYAIKKFSDNFLMSIYIYITMGFYTFYFNTLRQAIAMSIILMGMNLLINKNFIKYLFLIIFASIFHRSALIMLPVYFLIHYVGGSILFKCIVSFLSSMLLASGVLIYLAENNDKYSHYVESSEKAGGYFYIFLYCCIALLLFLLGGKLREVNNKYNILEQVYLYGISLTVPLIFLGTDPSGPKRVVYYFLMYLIFLFPIIFRELNSLKVNICLYLFLLIYFIYITYNIWGIYPYAINPYFNIF